MYYTAVDGQDVSPLCVPEQDLLLAPSLREWLPEDRLAFVVIDLNDQLDLSAITSGYEDEERGSPPYHPVMLTKVLVLRRLRWGLFVPEDPAVCGMRGVRVLAAGNVPAGRSNDHRCSQDRPTGLTRLPRAGAAAGAQIGRDCRGTSCHGSTY